MVIAVHVRKARRELRRISHTPTVRVALGPHGRRMSPSRFICLSGQTQWPDIVVGLWGQAVVALPGNMVDSYFATGVVQIGGRGPARYYS